MTARAPEPGEAAPDFTLPNQFGEQIRLEDLRGQTLLVVFYPFAFSGICTQELGDLRDASGAFNDDGVRVLAVSTDSKYTLRAFAHAEGYTFDLLSDFWPHGTAATAFGVFDDDAGIAARGTFIIDAAGVVRYSLVNPRGQARSVADYRAALATMNEPQR